MILHIEFFYQYVTILIACCYKTKCKHLACLGVNIDRDIESEMKNDVFKCSVLHSVYQLYCVVQCCIILYYVVLYCIAHCIIFYNIVFYHTVLRSYVLYFLEFYSILCNSEEHSIIIVSTVLSVLHSFFTSNILLVYEFFATFFDCTETYLLLFSPFL